MPRILCFLLPATLLATPAAAQSVLVPADSAEVANHAVTGMEYARFAAVVARMDSAFAADPDAFRGMERKVDGRVSLGEVAAWYESSAAMRAALAPERMTAREFLRAAVALLDALHAAEMSDAEIDALPAPQRGNARLAGGRVDELERFFGILRTVIRE
ncbi:MAG TPA: hypothetical protein VFR37_17495 [Longimicrobium sp.]|nr:hypothetical protein [Longimicrobium sp.]